MGSLWFSRRGHPAQGPAQGLEKKGARRRTTLIIPVTACRGGRARTALTGKPLPASATLPFAAIRSVQIRTIIALLSPPCRHFNCFSARRKGIIPGNAALQGLAASKRRATRRAIRSFLHLAIAMPRLRVTARYVPPPQGARLYQAIPIEDRWRQPSRSDPGPSPATAARARCSRRPSRGAAFMAQIAAARRHQAITTPPSPRRPAPENRRGRRSGHSLQNILWMNS